MGCKHCSFKSCCIKPWIPSITELQNGNKKGGKKSLFLPPGRPSRRLPSRTGSSEPIPHALPAQTCSWSRPARHRPGPAGFAHTRRSRSRARLPGCTHPAAPSPGIRWQSFGPGWGRRGSLSPSPSRTCLARPGPRPVPLGPGRGVRGPCPPGGPYSPLADMAQQPGPRQGARRRDPAGRGEGAARNAHPRAHAPARGEAARSVGTPPGCRTPGRAGTQWPRGPAAGRGDADSGRPVLGGARLPASPPPGQPPGASGRWGRAGRSAATPGGAFVPEGVERAGRVYVSPPPPGF